MLSDSKGSSLILSIQLPELQTDVRGSGQIAQHASLMHAHLHRSQLYPSIVPMCAMHWTMYGHRCTSPLRLRSPCAPPGAGKPYKSPLTRITI